MFSSTEQALKKNGCALVIDIDGLAGIFYGGLSRLIKCLVALWASKFYDSLAHRTIYSRRASGRPSIFTTAPHASNHSGWHHCNTEPVFHANSCQGRILRYLWKYISGVQNIYIDMLIGFWFTNNYSFKIFPKDASTVNYSFKIFPKDASTVNYSFKIFPKDASTVNYSFKIFPKVASTVNYSFKIFPKDASTVFVIFRKNVLHN